jgi:hypothetical protein
MWPEFHSSESSLLKRGRTLGGCLNSNKAEYPIVGALAISWHGFPRYSGDIDFLVRPTPDNAQRIRAARRRNPEIQVSGNTTFAATGRDGSDSETKTERIKHSGKAVQRWITRLRQGTVEALPVQMAALRQSSNAFMGVGDIA